MDAAVYWVKMLPQAAAELLRKTGTAMQVAAGVQLI